MVCRGASNRFVRGLQIYFAVMCLVGASVGGLVCLVGLEVVWCVQWDWRWFGVSGRTGGGLQGSRKSLEGGGRAPDS